MNIKKILIWVGIIVLVLFLLAVLFPKEKNGENGNKIPIPTQNYTPSENPLPKSNRLLGVDITKASDGDYNNAFLKAKEAGIDFIELSISWQDIETSKENYDNTLLKIANSYYPIQKTKIALRISPIDTNQNRVPSDLKNKPFNDREVIERYNKMVDYVLLQIPNLDLLIFTIGNEIDSYLGNDNKKWNQYTEFYNEVSNHINKKGIKTGNKATLEGLTKTHKQHLQDVNYYADVILVTYYPINSDFSVKDTSIIETDFNELTSIYTKPIYFIETGYPSSQLLGSSEEKQAEFIKQVFINWDRHSNIKAVNFNWLHDKSPSELSQLESYYGISNKNFREFLGTLGLRTYEGRYKLSFIALKIEAKARGW